MGRYKGRSQPLQEEGQKQKRREQDGASPVSLGKDAAPGQCRWVSAAGPPPPLAEKERSSFMCHSPHLAVQLSSHL